MKRLWVLMIAMIALLSFACGGNNNENTSTEQTETSVTGTESTATTATETTAATTLSTEDQDFMTKAAQGGMTEVTLGQLAQQKASNPAVKDFGSRMVTDHGKANDALQQVAQQKNFTLPTQPNADQQKVIDDLTAKSGKAFDKAYMAAMVKDHKSTVDLLQNEEKTTQDPDLKKWVTDTLPVIQEHNRLAKQVAAKVK
jgi:putative membrane protein